MRWGGFGLNGYVVYTDAKDAVSGKAAYAMPKWTFLFSPTYDAGVAAVGLSVSGQSDFYLGDQITRAPGSTFVNGYIKVRPIKALEVGLQRQQPVQHAGLPRQQRQHQHARRGRAGRQSGHLRQFRDAGPHDDRFHPLSLLIFLPAVPGCGGRGRVGKGNFPARLAVCIPQATARAWRHYHAISARSHAGGAKNRANTSLLLPSPRSTKVAYRYGQASFAA
jgi:hypothetical protein